MYLFITPPTADDVWWRLHAGERILRAGQLDLQNGWAYGDPEHEWVNHAAGHDVLAAAVHRVAGRRGLIFLYMLPLVWIAATLLRPAATLLRPAHRRDLAWALFLPPLLVLHYALRPFVFSDVFFFLAIRWAASRHDQDAIGLREALPMGGLFWLWGQLHGAVWPGLFFFGLFVVRWGRLARPWRRDGRAELKRLRWLAPLPLFALANAQHVRGLALAWRYGTGDFSWLSQLTEWQPAGPVVLLFAGAFTGGFIWATRSRGLALGRLLPLLPLGIAGALQLRHLPWLVLAAVALLRAVDRPALPRAVPARLARFGLPALCLLLAAVPALLHAGRLEDPRFFPAKLYDRMEAQCRLGSGLRVFAPHAWGGSLAYRFDGRLSPFIDARNDCFSKATFDRYFRITRLAPDWYELVMSDHPDGAVLPAAHPMVPELLRRGWVPGVRWRDDRFLVAPHRARTLCRRPDAVHRSVPDSN